MDNHNKGIFSLLFLAFLFASLGVVVRFISPYLGVDWQLFSRFGLASFLIFVFFRKKINFRNIIKSSKKDLWLILIRSVAFSAGAVLWVTAIPLTKLFTLTVIDSIPYSAIMGFAIMREKISLQKFFWILIAFFGVILISINKTNGTVTFGRGEIMLIISGFLIAFRNVSVRWQHKKLNDWELTIVFLIIATFIMGGLILVKGEKVPMVSFGNFVIILTILGGLINVCTHFLTHFGYRRVEAVLASSLLQTEAIFGIIMGYIFFREVPNFRELGGSLVLLFAVYRVNKLFKKYE